LYLVSAGPGFAAFIGSVPGKWAWYEIFAIFVGFAAKRALYGGPYVAQGPHEAWVKCSCNTSLVACEYAELNANNKTVSAKYFFIIIVFFVKVESFKVNTLLHNCNAMQLILT
jgi:hypothetical protein